MDLIKTLLEDTQGHEVEYNKISNILWNRFGIRGAEITLLITWVYIYMEKTKEV